MATENKPKYEINFEGKNYSWNKNEITPEQLRELVGLPADLALLVIDLKTGAEKPFNDGDSIEVMPGVGFSKKVGFKRG